MKIPKNTLFIHKVAGNTMSAVRNADISYSVHKTVTYEHFSFYYCSSSFINSVYISN